MLQNVTQGLGLGRALVNMVMNLWGP